VDISPNALLNLVAHFEKQLAHISPKLFAVQSKLGWGGTAKLMHPVSGWRRLAASLPFRPVYVRAENKIDIPGGNRRGQFNHAGIGFGERSVRVHELRCTRISDVIAYAARRRVNLRVAKDGHPDDVSAQVRIRNLVENMFFNFGCPPKTNPCLLYTSPSPRDLSTARMPSSA